MTKFYIENLKNADKFGEFKQHLPREWQKNIHNLKEFLSYFDRKDTSRDIYKLSFNEEKDVYICFRGDAVVEAYAEVEIGINRFIRLYGIEYLQDYDKEQEQYSSCSFGDYYLIEVV